MSDEVKLWNLALAAIGARSFVSSPTEKSKEADLCRLHYTEVRDTVLKSAMWPCARAYAQLALIRGRDPSAAWTPSDPPPQWQRAYAAPQDMIAPRFLLSFARFEYGVLGEERAIFAAEETPILVYTRRVTNTGLYDQGLRNAIVSLLASRLVIPASAKDNRATNLREQAVETVLLARTEFANESEDLYETAPSWVQVRGISHPVSQPRFFYPVSDLNASFL